MCTHMYTSTCMHLYLHELFPPHTTHVHLHVQPPPTHTENLNRKLKSRYQLFLLQEKLYYIHSLEASSTLKLMATILLSVERGISEEPSVFPALPLNQHDITARSKAHIPWIEEHSISLLPKLLFQNSIFHLPGENLKDH